MKLPFIEAGEIVTTHGVRGEVKVLCWLDAPDMLCDFDRCRLDGREMVMEQVRVQKTCNLVKFQGIDTMEEAQALDSLTERTWGNEQAVKLLWPKTVQAGGWTPLKNYAIAFLYEQADDWDEALSLIDLRNQIDSALFTQFTCGADNFLTNRMYAQFEPDGPLYRVPWDLNYSLGDASSSYDWLNFFFNQTATTEIVEL